MNIPGLYYFSDIISRLRIPDLRWTDFFEILIIAFLTYHILLWFQNTRAWQLMKGIAVIVAVALAAAFLNMTTILWFFQHIAGIAVTALIIILQPELRSAMEELGRKDFLSSLFRMDPGKTEEGRFSDRTINELVRACTVMGRVRTGALIVIEQTTPLLEWVRSGIEIDAILSSQLLINIFEKNTPLHDGAVIVRGNRIVSATSYLPLSSARMDKELGTRHRAAVGISENTDALTLIVSEETGHLSYTYKGRLWNHVTPEQLREVLIFLQNKLSEEEAARNAPRSPFGEIGKYTRWMKKGGSSQDKNRKGQKASGEAAGDSAEAEAKLTSGPGGKKADITVDLPEAEGKLTSGPDGKKAGGTGASGEASKASSGGKGGANV